MRSMSRNRQAFYYASQTGVTMGKDTDGNYTEEVYTYGDPVKKEAVISEGQDTSTMELFGVNVVYDKVITLNKGEDYLSVGSVLWVDTPISLDANGHLKKTNGVIDTPYNYVVVKTNKSLNIPTVAIRSVKVQ